MSSTALFAQDSTAKKLEELDNSLCKHGQV